MKDELMAVFNEKGDRLQLLCQTVEPAAAGQLRKCK